MLEICVDSAASLKAAVAGGADRVELCSALGLGGLTPSLAFAEFALNAGAVVHAMVRPRPGDFHYDSDDIAVMLEEMRGFQRCEVQGLVVGATHADGAPHADLLARFRDAAKDVRLALHRAIDLAPDPVAATRLARDLGYDLILTSGGARTADRGTDVIRAMVDAAGPALAIMAGSGVNAGNAADIMRATGVRHLHGSAAVSSDWSDPKVTELGFAAGPRRSTHAREVAAMKAAMQSVHAISGGSHA